MEWTWKRTLAVAIFFMAIIVLPLFLVSGFMMDKYQQRIDKDPKTPSARKYQLLLGNIYYKTFRSDRACECYLQFLQRYPEDPQRPFVMLRYGDALDDANRNNDAIAVYLQFLDDYPDSPDCEKAKDGINRCRYLKPRR